MLYLVDKMELNKVTRRFNRNAERKKESRFRKYRENLRASEAIDYSLLPPENKKNHLYFQWEI